MWQTYHESDFIKSQWAGGETYQMAIYPEDADYGTRAFLYRISKATVTIAESDFTALPGVARHLTILEGQLELSHDNGPWTTLKPYEVHAFDGGVKTSSKGMVKDFNLMTKAGCSGEMHIIRGVEGEVLTLKKAANQAIWVYISEGESEEAGCGCLLELKSDEGHLKCKTRLIAICCVVDIAI